MIMEFRVWWRTITCSSALQLQLVSTKLWTSWHQSLQGAKRELSV